jgi:hypothetical protein
MHLCSCPVGRTQPITILDYLASVIGDQDTYTARDFTAAGVEMIGGCQKCHATLGPHSAYPSRHGYWRCADCIGSDGYTSISAFARIALGFPGACPACNASHLIHEIGDLVFECSECGSTWTP